MYQIIFKFADCTRLNGRNIKLKKLGEFFTLRITSGSMSTVGFYRDDQWWYYGCPYDYECYARWNYRYNTVLIVLNVVIAYYVMYKALDSKLGLERKYPIVAVLFAMILSLTEVIISGLVHGGLFLKSTAYSWSVDYDTNLIV